MSHLSFARWLNKVGSMIIKSLILVLGFLDKNKNQQPTELQKVSSEFIKNTIRTEILVVGYKLLIAFVIACFSIFSIIRFGLALHLYFIPYNYGLITEIIIFGFLAAASLYTLYFLSTKKKLPSSAHKTSIVQPLITTFIEGFRNGLHAKKP